MAERPVPDTGINKFSVINRPVNARFTTSSYHYALDGHQAYQALSSSTALSFGSASKQSPNTAAFMPHLTNETFPANAFLPINYDHYNAAQHDNEVMRASFQYFNSAAEQARVAMGRPGQRQDAAHHQNDSSESPMYEINSFGNPYPSATFSPRSSTLSTEPPSVQHPCYTEYHGPSNLAQSFSTPDSSFSQLAPFISTTSPMYQPHVPDSETCLKRPSHSVYHANHYSESEAVVSGRHDLGSTTPSDSCYLMSYTNQDHSLRSPRSDFKSDVGSCNFEENSVFCGHTVPSPSLPSPMSECFFSNLSVPSMDRSSNSPPPGSLRTPSPSNEFLGMYEILHSEEPENGSKVQQYLDGLPLSPPRANGCFGRFSVNEKKKEIKRDTRRQKKTSSGRIDKSKIKNYSCTQCPQQFSWLKDLGRHTKAVHDQKKDVCPLCLKLFSRHDGLLRHIRQVHRNTVLTNIGKDP